MTPQEENLNIVVEAVRHKYDAVADVDNSLANRLGILFGFEIAVIIGYTAVGFTGMGEFRLTEAIMGLILLGASITCLFIAQFLDKKTYYYPFSVTRAKGYVQGPTKDLLEYLIDEGYAAIDKNRKRRNGKREWYSYAIRFSMVAIPLLVLSRL
jgi:hypothetical protein